MLTISTAIKIRATVTTSREWANVTATLTDSILRQYSLTVFFLPRNCRDEKSRQLLTHVTRQLDVVKQFDATAELRVASTLKLHFVDLAETGSTLSAHCVRRCVKFSTLPRD